LVFECKIADTPDAIHKVGRTVFGGQERRVKLGVSQIVVNIQRFEFGFSRIEEENQTKRQQKNYAQDEFFFHTKTELISYESY
jgi:hypothetical protein